jgi:hypothetical protein
MVSQLNPAATRPFNTQTLRDLAKRTDISLTLLLPATRPGADANRQTVLENLLFTMDPSWLTRITQALDAHGALGGGPGLALFAGDDFLEIFHVPVAAPLLQAGPTPFLLPLIFNSQVEKDFFILGVCRKSPRLIHFSDGCCLEEQLPTSIPASLEEFRGAADRELVPTSQWHEKEELGHYFHRLDVGLRERTRGHRLLLLGVEEDIALFRRHVDPAQFFSGEIHSSVRGLTLSEIAQRAGELAQQEATLISQRHVNRLNEWPDRSRIADQPGLIETAAADGRLQELLVPAWVPGLAQEATLNRAVVETLRHSGDVLAVPGLTAPALALLRY